MDAFDAMGSRFERAPASPNLAFPPRAIPLNLRLRLLFGGIFGLIGWGLLLMDLIFIAIFLPLIDLDSVQFQAGDLGVAAGTVTHSERTSGRSNGRFIYANHYEFHIPGQEPTYQGVSYATGTQLTPGQPVQIEYLAATPSLSRIQGMRGNLFDLSIIFILLLPLLLLPALALVGVGLVTGTRTMRLLERGLAGAGRVTGRSQTLTRINGRHVYRIAYEFADGIGQLRQGGTRSTEPGRWEDGQPIAVIYDPANPARSNALDNLPSKVGFDDFGNVRDPGPQVALLSVALPLIAIAGYLLVLGWIFAR